MGIESIREVSIQHASDRTSIGPFGNCIRASSG
jgi:hypothetical protein